MRPCEGSNPLTRFAIANRVIGEADGTAKFQTFGPRQCEIRAEMGPPRLVLRPGLQSLIIELAGFVSLFLRILKLA
jgi:hypothetical protein